MALGKGSLNRLSGNPHKIATEIAPKMEDRKPAAIFTSARPYLIFCGTLRTFVGI